MSGIGCVGCAGSAGSISGTSGISGIGCFRRGIGDLHLDMEMSFYWNNE
jgi:hypothetical protein